MKIKVALSFLVLLLFAILPLACRKAEANEVEGLGESLSLSSADGRIQISSLPFLVSQPGSYVVVKNLRGGEGITIEADNVTLDLNGFVLTGQGTGIGITYSPGATIINGTVENWDQGVVGAGGMLENVKSLGNARTGIFVGGGAIVKNCIANDNQFHGMDVRGAVVSGCVAMDNDNSGIVARGSSILRENICNENGSVGIFLFDGSIARDNVCNENGSAGISTTGEGFGSLLSGNVCSSNSNAGLRLGGGFDLAKGNHANGNGSAGIAVNPDGSLNVLFGNMTALNKHTGLHAQDSGNIIFGNTSLGQNVNFFIGQDNDAGPIGSAAASASPFANIED